MTEDTASTKERAAKVLRVLARSMKQGTLCLSVCNSVSPLNQLGETAGGIEEIAGLLEEGCPHKDETAALLHEAADLLNVLILKERVEEGDQENRARSLMYRLRKRAKRGGGRDHGTISKTTGQGQPVASMERVLSLVREERARQVHLWGDEDRSDGWWRMILDEELGEAARIWLEETYDAQPAAWFREMVQAAAVLVAWLEHRLNRAG